VAAFPGHGSTADGLIRMADKALYLAKTRGRDQVVVAPLDDAVVDDASAE
jgi:PleD family two-component response regulator